MPGTGRSPGRPGRVSRKNAERNERIANFFNHFNAALLALIVGACLFHIAHGKAEPDDAAAAWATIAAVAVAVAVAVAGMLGYGEFERIALRSEGMSERLGRIVESLKGQAGDISMEALEETANEAIGIMSAELSDWRVIFRTKLLEIHP